jgi:glutathione S-transferase
MALEVYWASGSPFAWRVLLTLEVKRLPYDSKLLVFSKQEHKAPEYLKLNPRGRVPTLKDGNVVLYESLAIMAYLDKKYPELPIFGRTPQETGIIWRLVSEHDSYLREAVGKVIGPLYFGGAAEKANEIRAAAVTVHDELAQLEAAVAKSPWLAGAEISASDIAVFPWIQSLLRAAAKEAAKPFNLGFLPFNERYPYLAAWVKRVEGIPGYERTYPPHWKE